MQAAAADSCADKTSEQSFLFRALDTYSGNDVESWLLREVVLVRWLFTEASSRECCVEQRLSNICIILKQACIELSVASYGNHSASHAMHPMNSTPTF